MRKLMVLAAMLAMMMVAAAPAFASHTTESGDAEFDVDISNEMGNQAVQIINQQNTGNVQQDANIEQDQDVDQDNDADVDVIQVQAGLVAGDDLEAEQNADVNVEQSNENSQDAEIDQTGVEQNAFAFQDVMQRLTFN